MPEYLVVELVVTHEKQKVGRQLHDVDALLALVLVLRDGGLVISRAGIAQKVMREPQKAA